MNAETIPVAPKRPTHAVINGLPREEYDALPLMNWSRLKWMGRSPAHYRHQLMQKATRTDAMIVGNATHVATFEPEHFRSRFAVWEGGPRRGKEWTDFKKAHRGSEILTEPQASEAQIIANAVRNSAEAAKYVTGGRGEVTVTWSMVVEGVGSIDCKARLDFLAMCGAITDLKTTKDASPSAFGRQVANLDYLGQAAWYADGYRMATGDALEFVIVAAEKFAPHVVQVYRVPEALLAIGRTRYQALLKRYAECAAASRWPGYVDGVTELVLPQWALPSLDEDVGGFDLDFTQQEA